MSHQPEVGPFKFSRHPITEQLIRLLSQTKPGEEVTYEQLAAECGYDRQKHRGLMETVTKTLEREYGIAIKCERNVGYRHLLDSEVPTIAEQSVKHIRRTAKKAARSLTYGVKDYSSMPNAAKVEYNTRVAQVGALHQAATRSAEKRLRGAVEVKNGRLELGSTLDLLKS